MIRDEGVIKFDPKWEKATPFSDPLIDELNSYRQKLYELGLVGAYSDGIGFGNISIKIPGTNQFYISGSSTGNVPITTAEHYCKVTECRLDKNQLVCVGPIIASSESLTHDMFYSFSSDVGAVVHVHNQKLWDKYKNVLPTTGVDVPYGTPEMAQAVKSLYVDGELKDKRVLVMAGHDEGLISFGKNLEEAFNLIISL